LFGDTEQGKSSLLIKAQDGKLICPQPKWDGRSLGIAIGIVVALLSCPVAAQELLFPAPAVAEQNTQASSQLPASVTNRDVPAGEESDDLVAMVPHLNDTRHSLSGQLNFIFQTHPPFHGPYSGRNSMDPNYEKATSRLLTLYTFRTLILCVIHC
jgi:hypothetical protein